MKQRDRLPVRRKNTDGYSQISESFNRAANSMARQFGLDVEDVKNAYREKPESLNLLNQTLEKAKSDRGENMLWTAVALILITPLAIWPGYYLLRNTQKIDNVRDTVKEEIAASKRLENKGPKTF
jgi:hypothetical protein